MRAGQDFSHDGAVLARRRPHVAAGASLNHPDNGLARFSSKPSALAQVNLGGTGRLAGSGRIARCGFEAWWLS
ncbi:MAG: hypothetical protein M3Q40_07815 [Pseudomonadota bacterium]|nr:hypothetical protein [Pseudomonadota bacterium]